MPLLLVSLHALVALSPLIPREVLFGNLERTRPQLAPDGQRPARLAPDSNNVLQIWVRTLGRNDDRIVTADRKRGIRIYAWAEDSQTLLYLQDTDLIQTPSPLYKADQIKRPRLIGQVAHQAKVVGDEEDAHP